VQIRQEEGSLHSIPNQHFRKKQLLVTLII
jgi:hypothetical protein